LSKFWLAYKQDCFIPTRLTLSLPTKRSRLFILTLHNFDYGAFWNMRQSVFCWCLRQKVRLKFNHANNLLDALCSYLAIYFVFSFIFSFAKVRFLFLRPEFIFAFSLYSSFCISLSLLSLFPFVSFHSHPGKESLIPGSKKTRCLKIYLSSPALERMKFLTRAIRKIRRQ